MPTYIVLGQFTDQGIRNVKETTKRAQALKDMAKKFGATVNAVYWTLGQYRHRDDRRRTGRHVCQRPAPEHRCARQRPNPDAPRLFGRRDGTDSRQDGLDRAADGSSSTLVACRRCRLTFCSTAAVPSRPRAAPQSCGRVCTKSRQRAHVLLLSDKWGTIY